jgi:hypothetical protein
MSEQFKSLMLHTRDEFEYWLFHFYDAENDFINYFYEQTKVKLDHTIESLDKLENWLLEKYVDHESILKFGNKEILDGASRYVGSVFIEALNGKWTIDNQDKDNVYYSLPIISYSNGLDCPITIITTALHRRIGNFIKGNLIKKLARMNEINSNIPT